MGKWGNGRDRSARRTLFWVMACALLVAASTFLPYHYAYAITPAGMEFQGVLVLPQDLYGYLAKMQLGAEGEWLFRLTYTPEDHGGALLSPFYLALGRFSSALGLPLILTFHLARLAAAVLLLVTVFYAALTIFKRRDYAWLSFAFVALGAGFGWLTTLLGYLSPDMLIPESVTYYAIFANPHFPLAASLLVLTFLTLTKAVGEGRASYAFLAGLLTLVQAFLQPFLVVTIYAVSCSWLIWRWGASKRADRREATCLGLALAVPLPGLAYDYAALYLNPILKEWSAQNLTPSPPLYDFLLGYGFIALLATFGWVYLRRAERPWPISDDHRRLLLVWPLVTLLLLYAPFGWQRRLVAGLHIVLSLLAVIGFYGLAGRLGGLQNFKTARRFLIVVILAMVPSNLFLLIFTAIGAGALPYPLYLKTGEVTALRWLSESSGRLDTVLASDETGNIVPALVGNRVFYGHPFETVRAAEKKDLLERFFAGEMGEKEERQFLAGYGIELIYYGRSERELGPFDPARRSYLEGVFKNEDVAIYRVKR